MGTKSNNQVVERRIVIVKHEVKTRKILRTCRLIRLIRFKESIAVILAVKQRFRLE